MTVLNQKWLGELHPQKPGRDLSRKGRSEVKKLIGSR